MCYPNSSKTFHLVLLDYRKNDKMVMHVACMRERNAYKICK